MMSSSMRVEKQMMSSRSMRVEKKLVTKTKMPSRSLRLKSSS